MAQLKSTVVNGTLDVGGIFTAPTAKVKFYSGEEGGHSTIFVKNNLVTTNDYIVGSTTEKLTSSSPDEEWLKKLIVKICETYPNTTGVTFKGKITPNSVGYYKIYIYDTSAVNSTTKLARYSFGEFRKYGTAHYSFGTQNYVFFNYLFVINNGSWGISITGNSGTATKLATARNLGVALGSTTAVTFDGSANQTSIPVSGTLNIANGGTGATSSINALNNLGAFYIKASGVAIPNEANIDAGDYLTAGTYNSASAAVSATLTGNVPYTDKGFKLYVGKSYGESRIKQFVTSVNSTHIIYRMSENTGSTWTKWYKIANIPSGNDNKTFAAIGSATKPVYATSGGTITACTYTLGANVNASTAAGTANQLAYYSGANAISGAGGLRYYSGNSTASTPKAYQRFHIYGTTVGNTAAELISNTAGVLSWGDAGPQITFDTSATPGSGQAGALIYTDHDTVATGASFNFVSNQGDWNVISKRFHARSGISIGTTTPNTSAALYVNGTGKANTFITNVGKSAWNDGIKGIVIGSDGTIQITAQNAANNSHGGYIGFHHNGSEATTSYVAGYGENNIAIGLKLSVNTVSIRHQLNNGTSTTTPFTFSVLGNGFIRDTVYSNAGFVTYRGTTGNAFTMMGNSTASYGGLNVNVLGTTSTIGLGFIWAGNNLGSGTANNAYGIVRTYGTTATYYTQLTAGALTANLSLSGTADRFTMPKLQILSTEDIGGTTSSSPPFSVGPLTGTHIEIDGNEILAKSNATTPAHLHLQDSTGGSVHCAGSGGLYVDNSLLRVINNGKTVIIGAQNSGFIHIYQGTAGEVPFIFNSTIATTTGDLGTSAYKFGNGYFSGCIYGRHVLNTSAPSSPVVGEMWIG